MGRSLYYFDLELEVKIKSTQWRRQKRFDNDLALRMADDLAAPRRQTHAEDLKTIEEALTLCTFNWLYGWQSSD